jgi:vault protein inter-alpha-trypsin-like protein
MNKNGSGRWSTLRQAILTAALAGGALGSGLTLAADAKVATNGAAVVASAPNPSLIGRVGGIDDDSAKRLSLRIADLNVDVALVGAIARTTITARFSNSTGEWLEGEFALALPEEAVVTGYALDVEGRMINGVLSEPGKARAAYQARIRRRVDPGVGDVSRANVFTTQVYPIRDDTGRTIRLSFVAPVHPVKGLVLPLVTDATVRNVKVNIRAQGVVGTPQVRLPDPLELQWQTQQAELLATASASRAKLSGELRIGPVMASAKLLTTLHPSGGRFFQIADSLAPRSVAPTARSGTRIRVYWDRSLSRRDDALQDEIGLIDRFITTARPSTIDVITFNSSGATVASATSAREVRALLTGLEYRGATSFATLRDLELAPAGQCVVFSDGVVTIDPREDILTDCRTTAVTSARDADLGYLRRLVRGSGGDVIRLGVQSTDAALSALRSETPRVLDVRDADGRALTFASFDAGPNGIVVVGEAPASGAILIKLAGTTETRQYALASGPAAAGVPSDFSFEGAGALWAADRVALLAAQDSRRNDVRTTSRRYSVAGPAMSFIVLETPRDYVAADLPMPKGYPSKWRAEYREAKVERDQERADARASRLEEVIARWEDQKSWWAHEFPRQLPPRKEEKIAGSGAELRRQDSANASVALGPPDMSLALQEIVTTGTRRTAPETAIEIEPWNPDRPYLKALKRAGREGFAAELARQEKLHGSVPAFYLDVAEFLHQQRQRAAAEEMLLSALELPASNMETQALIADRLVRYGALDRAIWLYGRVQESGPERPQPLRSMALALIKRAATAGDATSSRRDLARAAALLKEVIMTPWEDTYEGIELIALMDANALTPALKKHGLSLKLDPRLIAQLDVDLRVVIEWNTAATDMDLWLDEPTGERAIFSHPQTTIGGRLSNDMTSGFGPEEYLLHRAPDGRYQIRINAYARDQLNPNGATRVTAHLYRDFGRKTQREEMMDLELGPDDEGELLVGQFVVGSAKPPREPQEISEPPLSRE